MHIQLYFISAEAFNARKVHAMHIPIAIVAGKGGTVAIGATRFAYVSKYVYMYIYIYKYNVFQHMSHFDADSAFISSVLKLSTQARYTRFTFLLLGRMEPWRLEQRV